MRRAFPSYRRSWKEVGVVIILLVAILVKQNFGFDERHIVRGEESRKESVTGDELFPRSKNTLQEKRSTLQFRSSKSLVDRHHRPPNTSTGESFPLLVASKSKSLETVWIKPEQQIRQLQQTTPTAGPSIGPTSGPTTRSPSGGANGTTTLAPSTRAPATASNQTIAPSTRGPAGGATVAPSTQGPAGGPTTTTNPASSTGTPTVPPTSSNPASTSAPTNNSTIPTRNPTGVPTIGPTCQSCPTPVPSTPRPTRKNRKTRRPTPIPTPSPTCTPNIFTPTTAPAKMSKKGKMTMMGGMGMGKGDGMMGGKAGMMGNTMMGGGGGGKKGTMGDDMMDSDKNGMTMMMGGSKSSNMMKTTIDSISYTSRYYDQHSITSMPSSQLTESTPNPSVADDDTLSSVHLLSTDATLYPTSQPDDEDPIQTDRSADVSSINSKDGFIDVPLSLFTPTGRR